MSETDSKFTDWNDLHCCFGIDEVRRQFTEGLNSGNADNDTVQRELDSSTAPESSDGWNSQWQLDLRRNEKGGILPWSFNVALILENDAEFREKLAYCDFSYRVIKRQPTIGRCTAGEWEDADKSILSVWLGEKHYFNPSEKAIIDAVVKVSRDRRFHPVREYLGALEWDGIDRLDHWLVDALGARVELLADDIAADNNYLAVVGRKFLIGAVARVMRPPVKMDNVLILEGRQGRGKSSVVKALFGEWYSDAPMPLGDKDAYQNIQGVWGAELPELDSFNKAESTTAKAFFSQTRDRYRPSYGHASQDFPRQVVFVGTTNQDEYLKDYTGNRRYWPVRCYAVNPAFVIEQRDQLWAEAMHRFNAGEQWWPADNERAQIEREQDSRLQIDPWQYPIEDYLHSITADYVTSDMILNAALKKDNAHITRADQNRIAPILKQIGWNKKRRIVLIGNKKSQRHVYERPAGWAVVTPTQVDLDDNSDFNLPNE